MRFLVIAISFIVFSYSSIAFSQDRTVLLPPEFFDELAKGDAAGGFIDGRVD
jgi:hypothetical protein